MSLDSKNLKLNEMEEFPEKDLALWNSNKQSNQKYAIKNTSNNNNNSNSQSKTNYNENDNNSQVKNENQENLSYSKDSLRNQSSGIISTPNYLSNSNVNQYQSSDMPQNPNKIQPDLNNPSITNNGMFKNISIFKAGSLLNKHQVYTNSSTPFNRQFLTADLPETGLSSINSVNNGIQCRNNLISNDYINQNEVSNSNRGFNSNCLSNGNSYLNFPSSIQQFHFNQQQQLQQVQNQNLYPNQPTIITSQYNYDRMSNRLQNLNFNTNQNNIYSDPVYINSVNSIPCNYSTSSSTFPLLEPSMINESLIRRDNEIDRLKMRIILLQQQLDAPPLVKTNQNTNNDLKLNKIEYDTALLRMEMGNNIHKEEHINKLEQLLNQKEYEIEEMNKKYKEDLDKLESNLNKYKNMLNEKDEEFLKEKNKCSCIQKENERLQSKLNDCNEYITKLPTVDEVNETEKKINNLRNDNQNLSCLIEDYEKKLTKAKTYIREKNNELKSLFERIENLETEKEKSHIEFENYKQATQSVGDLMDKCAENASIKAEFECAKKMLGSLQDKLKIQTKKYEEQIERIREEMRLESELSYSLRNEIENKEMNMKSLENSIKDISNQNQSLISENLSLNEKLKSFEILMSNDTIKLFQLLFKEINICCIDLDELVSNCIDIYNGKSIDVSSLLGFSNRTTQNFDLDCKDMIANCLISNDYLMKKTNEIKKCRSKIGDVRKMVSDEYAEKLGSNMSCATQ